MAITGSAVAGGDEERGIDPNQGLNNVEITLPNRAAAQPFQLQAESYGVDFNDEYLRINRNGTATVSVFGTPEAIEGLEAAGYEVGATLESPATWAARLAERQAAIDAENRADAAATGTGSLRRGARAQAADDEIVFLRVDYFENYAGRFISVEAKTRLAALTGSTYTGPTLSLSFNSGPGTPIDATPRTMSVNIDPDTTPDTYIEHRELVRLADAWPTPTLVRIGSSTGASKEAPVNVWLGGGLPPMSSTFVRDFTTHYMDPTEVYDRFRELTQEYPNLTSIIPLPNKTNGYQRRAQANLSANATALSVSSAAGATAIRVASTAGLAPGTTVWIDNGALQERRTIATVVTPNPPNPNPNVTLTQPLALAHVVPPPPPPPAPTPPPPPVRFGEAPSGNAVGVVRAQGGAVVLTSRAWGHEGGNDITVELRSPGAPSSSLMVAAMGTNILVTLGTDATGELASTAAQVVAAINAYPAASALVKAVTYRGSAGDDPVLPRSRVNLSDFLTVTDASGNVLNAHVKRGPFEYFALRIGRESKRTASTVGVFLYCQQHAREWATPLTCLETVEELLHNYAIDPRTRKLVDNLDIIVLPSSNPDGSHYSLYNFASQRRNMTNYCVNGGKVTDDPAAASFWTPRINPSSGLPYTNTDAGSRTAWGVDLNRNNTFATLFDGFIGASTSCTNDTYTGPGEASEPEIQNELYIADTFKNIKFSNNIHSYGGYFMWAPGAYLPDRGEGAAVHANIGVEKYFFEAGDQILNRIKEIRGTVVLPERTGPIADVLYSAAGNSADEHWYNRGVIAYSFETGVDTFLPGTTLSVATVPGATGIRASNRNGFSTGDEIKIDTGANQEVRKVVSVAASNPPSPNPNVTLDSPLTLPHAAGVALTGGIFFSAVNFQPPYATEGKFEALEFAAGNYGLLESALAYARDDDPPNVIMTGAWNSKTPIDSTFQYVNEPSVIRYTTDGTKPTNTSQLWNSTGPREPGQVFHITQTTTFRWLATDMKGNQSLGSKKFEIHQ